MLLGLDISTSITGATLIDDTGKVILNEAWDLRKYKDIYLKADVVNEKIESLKSFGIKEIFIEQSLQSFRSGFSSAKTLSKLSRFNGIVSWMCYRELEVAPEHISASSARKKCGIKIPKGVKAKEVVIKHVIDNVPDVSITYTKFGNPRPCCYDMADSWVIAMAGHKCRTERSSRF